MKAFRCCSDGAPGSPTKRRPHLKVIDMECPQCGAKPGVECCGAGTNHIPRVDAWRAETLRRRKKRKPRPLGAT